jgi:hypothetical protein
MNDLQTQITELRLLVTEQDKRLKALEQLIHFVPYQPDQKEFRPGWVGDNECGIADNKDINPDLFFTFYGNLTGVRVILTDDIMGDRFWALSLEQIKRLRGCCDYVLELAHKELGDKPHEN